MHTFIPRKGRTCEFVAEFRRWAIAGVNWDWWFSGLKGYVVGTTFALTAVALAVGVFVGIFDSAFVAGTISYRLQMALMLVLVCLTIALFSAAIVFAVGVVVGGPLFWLLHAARVSGNLAYAVSGVLLGLAVPGPSLAAMVKVPSGGFEIVFGVLIASVVSAAGGLGFYRGAKSSSRTPTERVVGSPPRR